ncbi:DUF4424 domain-containing protein [Mesorhizobium sp. M00.F.Ca.ET.216.01.1.1]|uniref:DUF4424 domain-containing protein n=1 Tax=Mesorhizobium sp. M00.F.Ca.ET.216.01.1.1 TaxID=2500528 RepID=UPI000FDBF49F|nr:DUF4424 domain-containing protein [Mesorhizobium sp. M00.F.Ca.ET.216.01.1.1]TGQ42705.1 DUF4424 domain-containing protein [Mesorhizobium sp. M00.F.Ca.ET.216.01.1.1]
MFRYVLTAALAFSAAPAFANDSIAELGTGGLILSRSDAVAMESEDLYISPEKVTVDYVFRNNTDKAVDTIVAFPMPDIEGNPEEMPAIPEGQSDNFLGFEVTIDGVAVKPQLQQKVFALGIDISADLTAQNVPFYPFGDAAKAALAKLPQAVAKDWENRGIIIEDTSDDGSGMKTVYTPFWQLRSTYWWRSTFPANKAVHVSHRYKPSVGGTSSVSFFYDGQFQGQYASYKGRYCMDNAFENAVRKAAKDDPDGYPRYFENRIAYILTTGGNWASGSIGKFKLTIDKGNPKSLVSFCGDNVRKVGPTTFEMTAQDFYPEHDIDILLLEPSDDIDGDGGDGEGGGSEGGNGG